MLGHKKKLLYILCTALIIGKAVVFTPQVAYAQNTDPAAAADRAADRISNKFLDIFGGMIRSTLNAALGKIAYDSAVFVASGGQGQDSLVFDKPVGVYLKEMGNAAGGAALEGLATSNGLNAAALCDPGTSFRIGLTIGLDVGGPKQPYKPACTLTELGDNWKKAYADPDFSKFVELQFDSTANPLGVSLEVEDSVQEKIAENIDAAEIERIQGDFKDKADTVSKIITTPGSVIESNLAFSTQLSARTFDTVGKPFTDALNIFASTLVSKLMTRLQNGLANLASGNQLSELIEGKSSSAATGRKAAEATFAELKQPAFASTGSFDILAELGSCPEEEIQRTINNCAIGPNFQLAINEGWTVQEFVDFLNSNGSNYSFGSDLDRAGIVGDSGITYKGILLLKKYRIIPVGWQVAAEYLRNERNSDDNVTLQALVEVYDDCDADNYSPYCNLIDPAWVLKAPQNFCVREAPGPDILEPDQFDDDGNASTQEELIISRLNYCADERGCIKESADGVCTAYGYCTEEKRIYRFEGQACEPNYSSCQTFTDENGDQVSYVKSSINYNDCATDPGCQWYCLSKNENGDFNCASPNETYISCSSAYDSSSPEYDPPTSNIAYNPNESCTCIVEKEKTTCEIAAGSDRGYDPEADGVYNYWQCVITNDDATTSVCKLDSTCGADSPNYDNGICTCTIDDSCTIDPNAGGSDTQCTTASGNNCTLPEACNADLPGYSSTPVCEATTTDALSCGDTCYVNAGQITCTNSLGNTCAMNDTCDSTDVGYDSNTNTCACDVVDSCSIPDGQYSCESSNGNRCILGTQPEDPTQLNDTLYFDDNIQECDASDAGCHQYIQEDTETNLISNPYFSYFDTTTTTTNDDNKDFIGFCSHNGSGCATDASCDEDNDGNPEGQCIGWQQADVDAYMFDNEGSATLTPEHGDHFVRIPADTSADGVFEMIVDTGRPLYARTFTFAYRAASLQADTQSCSFSFTIGDANNGNQTSGAITEIVISDEATLNTYDTTWQDYYYTYTFPDDTSYNGAASSAVKVSIKESTDCDINIDASQLSETDSFSGTYSDYSENGLVYLNGDTLRCEPEDVGCELYVAKGKDSSEGVPGIITNPDSEACVNPDGSYNYSNPQCNQCNGNPDEEQSDDYYVGCSFYQEADLVHPIPTNTDASYLSDTERDGVMQRAGGRCSNDNAEHCFVRDDCSAYEAGDTNVTCDDQLSLIPATATQCSVAAVGCEEYTNLDAVSAGGEGLEYYTELKQCVKTDDPDIAVYYTFEGSDESGVEIEDHRLKVEAATGAPCTELDASSEEYNAECVDRATEANCQAVYGTDADCRQYIDEQGAVYYRYESEVVEASDNCLPLRNSLDSRVYYAIPDQSTSCSAEFAGCREYKGTDAGNEQDVIDEDFSANSTEDWQGALSTSNESIEQGGYSLMLQDDNTSASGSDANAEISYDLSIQNKDGDTVGLLTSGASYVLTFWAKVSDNGSSTFRLDGLAKDYYFTTNGSADTATTAAVTLDPDNEGGWQYYELGPVYLDDTETVDSDAVKFVMQFTGESGSDKAYIDNIQLTESSSLYLIQDSYEYCQGFEGCRQYKDRSANDYYLKSFKRLCGDDVVGCQAFIDTQNSTHPYTQAYNLENEYDQDDVVVQYDQPITLVYDKANVCSQAAYGCSEVGLPAVDERTGAVEDYSEVYVLDRPDDYSSILCEQPQLSCRKYTASFDGTTYFKNPGDKTCTLKEYTNESGNKVKGWFKEGSDAETLTSPDCPLQYDYADPSQPLGGVCNSNSIHVGELACTNSGQPTGIINQSDCEAKAYVWDATQVSNKVGALCNADNDCYPNDWSTGDPTPRCISDPEDDVDVYDGNVHQYQTYPNDGVTLLNIVKDFGWVGNCPAEQSGCSEYVDPYSPNIAEVNRNWSFEDDVRNVENVYYASDENPDGFPDYWFVPHNITPVDTGEVNDEGDIIYENTEVDVEGDGTIDFDKTCDNTAKSAIQTASSSYTKTTVKAADGNSAVEINHCILENRQVHRIERDKLYTVQGMVKMPLDASDDLNSDIDTPAEFSIGLHFYDSNYNEIQVNSGNVTESQIYVAADHVTLPDPETDDDGYSKWYRWQANIGLGSTVEFPDGAVYARVFVANHSNYSVFFDAVSFKQNDKYYYLDYTTDGTSEKKQTDGTNSCANQDTNSGEITADGGCVAFRDVTYDTQNYSQDAQACTSCLLTPNSDTCRGVIDACDTNTVLKVKKDRVCGEWLGCLTAQVTQTEGGDASTQCFEISHCEELDENGTCKRWVPKPAYDQLSTTTDLQYFSAPGDTDELQDIRNRTGYVKVGVTWQNTRTCEGGPNADKSCTANADCTDTNGTTTADDDTAYNCGSAISTDGFYPYGWMYEVGESGVSNGNELIEHTSFEQLYCDGVLADHTQSCIKNANTPEDPSSSQCYTTNINTRFTDADTTNDPTVFATTDTFNDSKPDQYSVFCPVNPAFGDFWPFGGTLNGHPETRYTRYGWQPIGESSVFITQYDPTLTKAITQGVSVSCTSDDCANIDTNNVLQFGASNEDNTPFTGGITYDLSNNISPNGTYALSFQGRFPSGFIAEGGDETTPTALTVCLNHNGIIGTDGNDLVRKDCFVSGYGEADIVFAIDTSSSMAQEIFAVQQAAPNLAYLLSQQGIDTHFALIDMDKTNSVNNNRLALDFTSNICDSYDANTNTCTGGDFNYAMSQLIASGASVDPANAIYETAINSFTQSDNSEAHLNFRTGAQKFIIVVSDTADEISSNNVEMSGATTAAVQGELTVYGISNGKAACDNGSSDPCTLYYDPAANETGGQTYDYTNNDGTTSNDWVNGTDIVSDIYTNIILKVDIFQLTTELEHYSFGPIVTTERDITNDPEIDVDKSRNVTTELEFLVSDGSPVQIDNVSLLPVLEVQKNVDPIGRTCRAYPASDARQCDYVKSNGTMYEGWKGYCLETDPSDTSRCIMWFPLDALQGETSIVTRQTSGYTGRSQVYYCLASKGLEQPGFCEKTTWNSSTKFSDVIGANYGEDVLCIPDDQGDESGASKACGGKRCHTGALYVIDESNGQGDNRTENNDITVPVSEVYSVDGGSCKLSSEEKEAALNCAQWDTGGADRCEADANKDGKPDGTLLEVNNDTIEDESECTSNGGIWISGEVNVFEAYTNTDCLDYWPPDYDDDQTLVQTEDFETGTSKLCFYDLNNDGIKEVRSSRKCKQRTDCTSVPAETFQCASLQCNGSYFTQDCSVGGNECAEVSYSRSGKYQVRPMRWQMYDPYDAGSGYDSGIIMRLPANEVMRNIHMSEIENIEFNPGSAGDGWGGNYEYPFWGQLGGPGSGNGADGSESNGTIYDSGVNKRDEIGNIWVTDFQNGAISQEKDGTYKPWNDCYAWSGGDAAGIGCWAWGLYDSEYLLDRYSTLPNFGSDGHGYDLVYTWGWSNFNNAAQTDEHYCDMGQHQGDDSERLYSWGNLVDATGDQKEDWFLSPCVTNTIKYIMSYDDEKKPDTWPAGRGSRNPWEHVPDRIMNQIYQSNVTTEKSGAVKFTRGDLEENGKIWPGWETTDEINPLDNDGAGGNILSLYLDFNDQGYLQSLYTLQYIAANGTTDALFYRGDITTENMMHLDLYVRESCALIAEAVDSSGDNRAWSHRASSGDYEINGGTTTAYGVETPTSPFGSISPSDDQPTSLSWDYLLKENYPYVFGTYGQQPTVAHDGPTNAGHPLTCIGKCSQKYYVSGDPTKIGHTCETSTTEGVVGICMGVGDSGISNGLQGDQAVSASNFDAQLSAASKTAQSRLKHVFADIAGNFYKLNFVDAKYNTNATTSIYIPDTGYWNNDKGENIFTVMQACNTDGSERLEDEKGKDGEYCGVYPTVDSIKADNQENYTDGFYDIENGRTIKLQFTSHVDQDQLPLKYLYINWGDGDEAFTKWDAQPTNHIFTHAYNCGPEYAPFDEDSTDATCTYTPRITVVDNWFWCSGKDDASITPSSGQRHRHSNDPADQNLDQVCGSYTTPQFSIRVDATN